LYEDRVYQGARERGEKTSFQVKHIFPYFFQFLSIKKIAKKRETKERKSLRKRYNERKRKVTHHFSFPNILELRTGEKVKYSVDRGLCLLTGYNLEQGYYRLQH